MKWPLSDSQGFFLSVSLYTLQRSKRKKNLEIAQRQQTHMDGSTRVTPGKLVRRSSCSFLLWVGTHTSCAVLLVKIRTRST